MSLLKYYSKVRQIMMLTNIDHGLKYKRIEHKRAETHGKSNDS